MILQYDVQIYGCKHTELTVSDGGLQMAMIDPSRRGVIIEMRAEPWALTGSLNIRKELDKHRELTIYCTFIQEFQHFS